MPYYMIIKEHFDESQLAKFVDPTHICSCNHCGKDLDSLVRVAESAAKADLASSAGHSLVPQAQVQINSEELQSLKSENEELLLTIKAQDLSIRNLSLKVEKLSPHIVTILSEEAVTRSAVFLSVLE